MRTSVGEVNDKVDSLGRSLEETQERTRQNEGKIAEVDRRPRRPPAQQAQQRGRDRRNCRSRRGRERGADAAGAQGRAVDKASKRLVYEVVLSEDRATSSSARPSCRTRPRRSSTRWSTQLKADPKGAYFEIEGHTDNVGDKEINEKLGLERAEAVKRYLYEQHQIPLHKMNVISYGEEKPVAPNKTKDGRAQNRRVVIRVLA